MLRYLFLILLLEIIPSVLYAAEIARLTFPATQQVDLRINDDLSVPPFNPEIKRYRPISFSALTPNSISVGNIQREVSVDKISSNDFITLQIGDETYQLNVFPQDMPTYQITKNDTTPGYLLMTPFETSCQHPSYAYIVHTNGDLL